MTKTIKKHYAESDKKVQNVSALSVCHSVQYVASICTVEGIGDKEG